jgi:hypothetical protein
MPDYPIIPCSSLVLEIYQADLSAGASALPADLASSVQCFQDYRNIIANVQDEADTFCMPAWIYKQWKDGLV